MKAIDLYYSLGAVEEQTVYETPDGERFVSFKEAQIYNLMYRVRTEPSIEMDVAAEALRILMSDE